LTASTEPIYFRGKAYRAPKNFYNGTHRIRSPEETFEIIKPYFKQVGLTRIADITGLDRIGISVMASVRPNAVLLAVDSGKGFTKIAAQVSAAMECIERYCGETCQLDSVYSSYEELAKRHTMIPENRLPLTKNSIFHPKNPENWVFGWDIVNQEEVAVPLEMVITPNAFSFDEPSLFSFQIGTNGLASGNVFLEAVCAGLYEVIERDGIACNDIVKKYIPDSSLPKVRLETIQYPTIQNLMSRLKAAGVGLEIVDATMDTNVPIYMCIVQDEWVKNVGVYKGYGAHYDPEIAMVRAVTEAVQARAVYIAGSRDDLFHQEHTILKLLDDGLVMDYLTGTQPASIDASQLKNRSNPNFEQDIHQMLESLKAVGLNQVIVFDLTPPEFDVSVVRVIVPGLEGYLFDYYRPGERAKAYLEGSRP